MRQGLSFAEVLNLHRSGAFATSTDDLYLLVDLIEPSAEQATVELAGEGRPEGAPPSPNARLFAVGGSHQPSTTVGRSPEADLELADPAVSKLHLRLHRAAGLTSVSDEGSQNGTKLNGSRLAPTTLVPLRDGDVLEIAERYRATFLSSSSLVARLNDARVESPLRAPQGAYAGLLAGKVAVITGGGRGLGRAYALRFAAEGCRVLVNDTGAPPYGEGKDESVAAAVVAEIEQAGGNAYASAHDVSEPTEVQALFALAQQRFGAVDILVCSAGVLHTGSSVLELDPQVWDGLMRVNARGTFLCMQAAARSMVEQGRGGRIITTSSMTAMNGSPGLLGYAASKASVFALSQTAALELAPHGITVNILAPMAWTRLTAAVPAFAAIPNVEQVLSASYVADVALFLASDLSAGVTGQVVDIGGPQLSFYKTKQSAPVVPDGARWTPEELQRRWSELTSW